jgi:hypothetical protein
MNCKYCKNTFRNKSSLQHHQKTAKYCLDLRGIKNNNYTCTSCKKIFSNNYNLSVHTVSCKKYKCVLELKNKFEKVEIRLEQSLIFIEEQKQMIGEQKQMICDLQDKLENIALKAVSTSSTTNNNNTMTKNIQINNFLKNAPALTDAVIQDNIKYLTLDHHVQGAEGYAKYAMEFPFKGRIVCVDVARNKIKYKDGDGNVIEDAGFQKMMMKLCKAIYGKSYDLSIEHLDKLARQFTEKELEQYDYLEAAKAIAMYSKGSESEFCRKIIKIISKSVSQK